jgi:hypothetical protein
LAIPEYSVIVCSCVFGFGVGDRQVLCVSGLARTGKESLGLLGSMGYISRVWVLFQHLVCSK